MAIIVVNGVPRFQDDSRSVYITPIYHACGDTSEVITYYRTGAAVLEESRQIRAMLG